MADDSDARACESSFATRASAIQYLIRYMGSRRIVYDIKLITILSIIMKRKRIGHTAVSAN